MQGLRRCSNILVILCGVVFVLAGCGDNKNPDSRGASILGQYAMAVNDAVPGLHDFSVVGGTRNNEFVYIAWFDSATSASTTTGPTTYEARTPAADIKLVCTTENGETGVVSIAGKDYQLADGAFFLVSSHGGSVRVQQEQRDLSKIPTGGEALHNFAMADPTIKEFYADKATEKSP